MMPVSPLCTIAKLSHVGDRGVGAGPLRGGTPEAATGIGTGFSCREHPKLFRLRPLAHRPTTSAAHDPAAPYGDHMDGSPARADGRLELSRRRLMELAALAVATTSACSKEAPAEPTLPAPEPTPV